MPKVLLTAEQRMEARHQKLRNMIADGLAKAKNREKMSNEIMAKKLGIGREAAGKLLGSEEVKVSSTAWFRIMDMAGVVMKERREEDTV